MEKTNSVLEQDVAKKKKRRKRKSAAKKTTVATVKNETKKVEVVKETKEVKVPEKKEEKVTYNTFEIEKLKADLSDKLSYQSVPMNLFSVKNLLLTVCVCFLIVLFVVAGYYIGAFNYESKLSNGEYDASHKVTGMVSEIEFSGYTFYVPFGFEHMDSETSVKIVDLLGGTSIELLGIAKENVVFNEVVVDKYRLDLQELGYVIYSSYILEDGMLVYTGLDTVFNTVKIIYVVEDGVLYKVLVSNEYETIKDDVYDFVNEFLGR